MSLIEVSAGQIPGYQGGEETLKLRIYADQTFTDADGSPVMGGAVGTENFYQEIPCTVTDDVVNFPTFEIQTTEDGEPGDTTYTFAVFTDDGDHVATVYQDFRIAGDHASPTTLGDIATYNAAEPACLSDLYYTAAQVDAIIAGLFDATVKMTEVVYGVGKLSHAALSIAAPIVMGHNDPLMRQMRESYYLESYTHTVAGLNAAIAAISTNRATLVITADLPISSASVSIPSNILVRFEGNGKVTMSGNRTLTIGLLDEHCGRQIFFGVDASNHVIVSNCPQHHLGWYVGISSSDDATNAIADIFNAVTSAEGGLMLAGNGSWKVNDMTVPNYFEICGSGHGQDGGGTRFIPKDTNTDYLFRTTQNFRNFSMRNCALDTVNNTGTEGVRIQGTSGNSGFGANFTNVTFRSNGAVASNCPPLLNTSTDQAYEIMRANFYNCQWIGSDGSKCVYLNSVNTMFKFDSCSFSVGKGDSFGIDGFNCGLEVINCDFRGQQADFVSNLTSIATLTCSIISGTATLTTTGAFTQQMVGQRVTNATAFPSTAIFIKRIISSTSAELTGNASGTIAGGTVVVYKWTTNTLRAGTAIRLGAGALLKANIQGCADEGFNYSLRVIGGSFTGPAICLTNNTMQGRIYLEVSCVIYSRANRYYSCAWGDAFGTASIIYSEDTWENSVIENNSIELTTAKQWGPDHAGVGSFATLLGYREGISPIGIGRWLRIIAPSDDRSRPTLDIGTFYNTVATDGQTLLRMGIWDEATDTYLYGHQYRRNPDSGWGEWKATQDPPYIAWVFDFPIGYDVTKRVNIAQATNRATTVIANGIHGTITTHNASLAAGASEVFQLTNSFIQNGHDVEVWVQDGSVHNKTTAQRTKVGGGLAMILVKNEHSSTAETGSLKIGYRVVIGGKYDGTTTL